MHLRVISVFAAVVVAEVAACSSGSETSTPTTDPAGATCVAPGAPAVNIPYASEPGVDPSLLSLDIYPVEGAECGSAPVVVYVHGGGWARGDKANKGGLENKQALASNEGWVLVSVNYRLSNPAEAAPLQHPAHATDVGRAVAYVEENISAYGGNPDGLVLMGHSSGAGTASLLGAEPRFITEPGGSPVRCVVSLDTEAYDIAKSIATGGDATVATYENAFGTDPEVWDEASAINQLDDDDPVPDFLIATRGTRQRITLSEDFGAAVEDAGGTATVVVADDYSHADANTKVGEAGETVLTPPILDFVDACTT